MLKWLKLTLFILSNLFYLIYLKYFNILFKYYWDISHFLFHIKFTKSSISQFMQLVSGYFIDQWRFRLYAHRIRKTNIELYFSSVKFSSVVQSCPTLCNPMNRSTPGLPVHRRCLLSSGMKLFSGILGLGQ